MGEVVIAVVEEEVGAAAAALVACACWIFWAAVLFRLAAASEAADIQIAVAGAIARSWEPTGDTGAVCIDFSWSECTLFDPLNPKPSTLNPKPSTLNPKPYPFFAEASWSTRARSQERAQPQLPWPGAKVAQGRVTVSIIPKIRGTYHNGESNGKENGK